MFFTSQLCFSSHASKSRMRQFDRSINWLSISQRVNRKVRAQWNCCQISSECRVLRFWRIETRMHQRRVATWFTSQTPSCFTVRATHRQSEPGCKTNNCFNSSRLLALWIFCLYYSLWNFAILNKLTFIVWRFDLSKLLKSEFCKSGQNCLPRKRAENCI